MSNGLKIVLLLAEVITVASALLVTFHPNILYASVALLMSFMGVAVMFIYAGADFIAGAQVVIYVGGVTILILFAIMLTQWLFSMKLKEFGNKLLLPLAVVALLLAPALAKMVHQMVQFIDKTPLADADKFAASPKTALIGQALLSNYVLPFEVITVLLLGALVGAVWLARPAK